MAKTYALTGSIPDKPPLENLGVLPNETNQQAYERIRKLFCAHIDSGETAQLAEVVHDLAESEHAQVVVSAYMSACVRLNSKLRNRDYELQIMMLPLSIRAHELAAIPSDIDSQTASEIQRIVESDLIKQGMKDITFIPSNRLLTSLEFENEHPEALQDILRSVAATLKKSKKTEKHNIVIIPKDEEADDYDDNLMYDGQTFVTTRLMPVIVVQQKMAAKITSISTPETLQSISQTISLSCQGTVSEGPHGADAQSFGPAIQAFPITNPFLAEALIQSKISVEKLYFDINQFIESEKSSNIMAAIVFAPLVGILTVDVAKTDEEGQCVDAEFSFNLKSGHGSYVFIHEMRETLNSLGIGLVSIEVIGDNYGSQKISTTIH